MVNAKLIVTVVAVCMAVAGAIIVYMVSNGLSTSDITLYDACVAATSESATADTDQCEDFLTADVQWNTELPCMEGSSSTFTFQGLFDAWQLADSDPNYDAIEYIDGACGDAGRKLKVNKRMLGEDKEDAFTVGRNYGPCSMKGSFIVGAGHDDAECSGLSDSGTCSDGKCCRNPDWSRSGSSYLVDGCYNHDICLQKGSASHSGECGDACPDCFQYDWAGNGKDCDGQLQAAAGKCVSKGWWGCDDSVWASVYVRTGMAVNPNNGFCGI
jgi:hypothetical protein